MKINTGAPTNAVTIPDSNSPGRPRIRPATSERRRTQLPTTAERGRIFRISGPNSKRTRCGNISQKKQFGPDIAVLEAQNKTPANAAKARIYVTFIPSPVAASSPRAYVFKEEAKEKLMTNPTIK